MSEENPTPETAVAEAAPAAAGTAASPSPAPTAAPNPYVGPRPFTKEEAALFFGRDDESSDLRTLVFADRIVLFDAASGAGKSSLLNAALRQKLKEDHFDLVPADTAKAQSGRVRGSTAVAAPASVPNIFVYNLLTSIDEGRHTADELAAMTLKGFLDELPAPPPAPDQDRVSRVLIIDQFEEIFTSHLDRWEDRAGFFKQLREAVAAPKAEKSGNGDGPLKPDIFVILAMRDDAAAMLDQYAHLLPGRLRTRFNMQRLDHDAALAAIRGPAKNAGRPFAEGVAEELRDNLSEVDNPERKSEKYKAEFIEPVQLQVVCWQLWEELRSMPCDEPAALPPPGDGAPAPALKPCQISKEDLLAVARKLTGEPDLGKFVDGALQRFYESVVSGAADSLGLTEFELRSWIEDELITGQGTRNLVDQGETETAGLSNTAVEELKKRLLLHQEERGAVQFFELFHDRLVTPIKVSNAEWFKKQDVPLQRAREWKKFDALGKGAESLARGSGLKRIETYVEEAQALGQPIPPDLVAFLKASRDKEAAAKQGRNYIALLLGFIALLVVVAVIWTFYVRSTTQRIATTAQLAGLRAGQISDKQGVIANPAVEPQLSLLLAVEALDSIETSSFEEVLDQRVGANRIDAARQELAGKLRRVLTETGGVPLRAGHALTATAILSDTVTVSPDGRWVAGIEPAAADAQGDASRLHIWDLSHNPPDEEPGAPLPGGDTIAALAFDPSGGRLFVGHRDGSLDYISLNDRQPHSLDAAGRQTVQRLAVSPDRGRWLAVADGSPDVALYPVDGATAALDTPIPLTGHSGGAQSIVFSPDGRWLATVDGDGLVRVWDVGGAEPLPVDDPRLGDGTSSQVAFSQDSAWLAAAGPDANVVYLWGLPLEPGSAAYKIKFGAYTTAPADALAFAQPAGSPSTHLIVGHKDGAVLLWSLPSEQARAQLAAETTGAGAGEIVAGSAEPAGQAPIGKGGADETAPIGKGGADETAPIGKGGADEAAPVADAPGADAGGNSSGEPGLIGKGGGDSGASGAANPAPASSLETYPDRWPPVVLSAAGPALVASSGKWLLTTGSGGRRLCQWDLIAQATGQLSAASAVQAPAEAQKPAPSAANGSAASAAAPPCTPLSGHENAVVALYPARAGAGSPAPATPMRLPLPGSWGRPASSGGSSGDAPGWISVAGEGVRYWDGATTAATTSVAPGATPAPTPSPGAIAALKLLACRRAGRLLSTAEIGQFGLTGLLEGGRSACERVW